MNCVVMGGGGFIGSHLTEALLAKYDQVTVFDKPSAPYLELLSHKGADIVVGDFSQPSQLQKALIDTSTVFHLISTTIPASSVDNPVFDVESNLISSINLLYLARNAGVKKIIFISSGGTVYGVPREIPISEDHPTQPISSYGIVKLAVEKYLHLYWILYGVKYSILRVSNAYGERQIANTAQGIIPTILDRAIKNKRITIWGDGSVIRDYIHVSDIVAAFIRASEVDDDHRIFNIGSGVGHSINDIIKIVEKLQEKKLDVVYEPGRAYDLPINILKISLASDVLGWMPKKNLQDGVQQTLEYMRNSDL